MKGKGFKNFMKKNGFYVVLFSAVFLVVAIAVVVSLNNVRLMSKADPDDTISNTVAGISDNNNVVATTKSNSVAISPIPPTTQAQTSKQNNAYPNYYQSQFMPAQSSTGVAGVSTDKTNNDAYATVDKTALADNSDAEKDTAKIEPIVENEPAEADNANASNTNSSDEAVAENDSTIDVASNDEDSNVEQAADESTESVAQVDAIAIDDELAPTFSSFTEENEMLWPVDGAIAMDFSNETGIYDKTLELYRTNDSVAISATAGTEVKAAAAGEVIEITWNTVDGYTVIIDNGNGWTTTYSQLQKEIAVSEGQVVMTGEVIGRVNNPTNYGVALGEHLVFAVSKDDVRQDPKMVLAQR